MTIIDTISGENLIVAPHGYEVVTLRVQCPRFGGISHVRLSHDQVASPAGALTGLVLDHGSRAPQLSDEP